MLRNKSNVGVIEMENPYVAPKSDLDIGESFKRSIGWKIYFFIITILSFLGMISFLVADDAGIIDYIEFLLLIIATAGFYGFVFLKRILFPKFWIPFLIFYVIASVAYEPLSSVDMRQGMSDAMYSISTAIAYLFSLPAYYALYKYGKETEHPWKNA